jgi:PAS domain S-box-containing protein
VTEGQAPISPMADRAPVLLARCDANHRYRFVNGPYAQRFGLNPVDVIGQRIPDVLGEETFARLRPYAEAALEGEHVEFDGRFDDGNLGLQSMHCTFDPEIDAAGQVVGYVATGLNITERDRAEQELRAADRRKDEFLAILAHELRSPLSTLQSGLEIIRHGAATDQTLTRTADMMERQIHHVIRLVDDLLDVSRITRGKLRLQRRPVVLAEVVEQAREALRPIMEARGHQLIVHCRDDRLTIEGDPVRLAQILSNLLSNSTKYTERGGTITLTVERDGDTAVIKVTDTGIGIPPGSLENVFEMFSQARVDQARFDGGLGIGLALVRSLVQMHGGSVIADSRGVGTGSTFTVRLPAIRNAASTSSHSRIP